MGNETERPANEAARTVSVRVFRHDPSSGRGPHYETFVVPFERGMSAMTALDYIYENLDSTVAYYHHAGCDLGICARCVGRVDGKAGLFCQAEITGDVTLEPWHEDRVLKDLVTLRDPT